MRPIKHFVSAFIFTFLTTTAFAGTMGLEASNIVDKLKDGEVGIHLGGYWRNPVNEQFIRINGADGDTFTVADGNARSGLFGVGYFLDGMQHQYFNMSFGVDWYYLAKTKVLGTILQENQFENFKYRYDITQYPLYFVAKSQVLPNYFATNPITVDFGIGPNFMQTQNFEQTPILPESGIFTPIVTSLFAGQTSTVFSFTAGAEITVKNFDEAPLRCGYRFFYLGQGHLKTLNNQILDSLGTGTLYANAVLCSLYV